MFQFNDKVAVITGAGQGIGKELARQALNRGMKVALLDRNPQPLDTTAREFSQEFAADSIFTDVCDITDINQQQASASRIFNRFGEVQVLVNNAGVAGPYGALWQVDLEQCKDTFNVNVFGAIAGIKTYLPQMLAQTQECLVVNIASIAGLLNAPFCDSYFASKHAMVSISESLKIEVGMVADHINVAVVCPGWVKTSLPQSATKPPSVVSDPIAAQTLTQVVAAIENGDCPQSVAEKIFAALQEKQFYILPHTEYQQAIQERTQAVLAGEGPAFSW